jgi:hypothetical protein
MADSPISCTLSSTELVRRREILAALRDECVEVRKIDNGVSLRFAPGAGTLARLAEVIDLERQCCRFLRFRLDVEPDGGPVRLDVTGPPGTETFLEAELGWI